MLSLIVAVTNVYFNNIERGLNIFMLLTVFDGSMTIGKKHFLAENNWLKDNLLNLHLVEEIIYN
uniref:Uncharacterized protein n=1 Tax=Lepeophtheirus salmonis TaxID=72036 RepID=A0A0K2UIJ1_LEPSM